jgi:hypothetical protein
MFVADSPDWRGGASEAERQPVKEHNHDNSSELPQWGNRWNQAAEARGGGVGVFAWKEAGKQVKA